RSLLRAEAARGEDHFVGLAGEQVAAAGPAVHEQSAAGREPALDRRAVVGGGAGDHLPGLLVHPAERGDVVVGAEQDARLTRPGLGAEVRLPLREAVRAGLDPPRKLRDAAIA